MVENGYAWDNGVSGGPAKRIRRYEYFDFRFGVSGTDTLAFYDRGKSCMGSIARLNLGLQLAWADFEAVNTNKASRNMQVSFCWLS